MDNQPIPLASNTDIISYIRKRKWLQKQLDNKNSQIKKLQEEILKLQWEADGLTVKIKDYEAVERWDKNPSDVFEIEDWAPVFVWGNWWILNKWQWYLVTKLWDNYDIQDASTRKKIMSVSWTIYPDNDDDQPHFNSDAIITLAKDAADKIIPAIKIINENSNKLWDNNIFTARTVLNADKDSRKPYSFWLWRRIFTNEKSYTNQIFDKDTYQKLVDNQYKDTMNRF